MSDIEFYGFKFLKVNEIGKRIKITSPHQLTEWVPGVNRANCKVPNRGNDQFWKSAHPDHLIPAEHCKCGIYSCLFYSDVIRELPFSAYNNTFLLTLIRSTGKVLLGERNVIRAQEAEITHVVLEEQDHYRTRHMPPSGVLNMSEHLHVPAIRLADANQIVRKRTLVHLSRFQSPPEYKQSQYQPHVNITIDEAAMLDFDKSLVKTLNAIIKRSNQDV